MHLGSTQILTLWFPEVLSFPYLLSLFFPILTFLLFLTIYLASSFYILLFHHCHFLLFFNISEVIPRFIHPFIYSIIILSTYHVPGITEGSWDTVHKTEHGNLCSL